MTSIPQATAVWDLYSGTPYRLSACIVTNLGCTTFCNLYIRTIYWMSINFSISIRYPSLKFQRNWRSDKILCNHLQKYARKTFMQIKLAWHCQGRLKRIIKADFWFNVGKVPFIIFLNPASRNGLNNDTNWVLCTNFAWKLKRYSKRGNPIIIIIWECNESSLF